MAKSNKADEIQLKQIEKAVAKADEAVKKAAREAADEAKEAAEKEAVKEAVKARREHGVEKIEGKSKSWWRLQNKAIIKQEAELRGYRFTDIETKGGKSSVLGVKTKIKGFKKEDYLEVLFKILKL